jgi:hypothetical protein
VEWLHRMPKEPTPIPQPHPVLPAAQAIRPRPRRLDRCRRRASRTALARPVQLPRIPHENKDDPKIIARIRERKATGEKWRAIYATTNEGFGTTYEYSRSGSLHKMVQGEH